MSELLAGLEASALSEWVRGSDWPYPILLDLHLLGLAIVVGLTWMLDLRVLGVGRQVAIAPFRHLFPAIWCGFALNAISGSMLFAADASRFYASWDFRIKVFLIVLALGALIVQRRQFRRSPEGTGFRPATAERVAASVSLLAWLGTVVAGRLIAYTS
jgi:hypothetical protein